jgi:hypothetical protein
MSTYRIVCVKTEHPHRHILSVGTGTDAAKPTETFTVTQVRDMLDKSDVFYTTDSKGTIALVRKATCKKETNVGECDVKTIKSAADATKDNNLDNLATCP